MLLSPFQETSEVAMSAKPKTKSSAKVGVKAKVKDNKNGALKPTTLNSTWIKPWSEFASATAKRFTGKHRTNCSGGLPPRSVTWTADRLLGVLRRLEAMYAMLDEADRLNFCRRRRSPRYAVSP